MKSFIAKRRKGHEVEGDRALDALKKTCKKEVMELEAEKEEEEVDLEIDCISKRHRLIHKEEPESEHIVSHVGGPVSGFDFSSSIQSNATISSKSLSSVYEKLDHMELVFNESVTEAEQMRYERDALRQEVNRLRSESKMKDSEVNALSDKCEFLRKENDSLTARLSNSRFDGAKAFRGSGVFKELMARESVSIAKILLDKHISKTRVLGGYKDGFDPDRYRRVDKEFRQFVDISRYYDDDDEFVGLKFGSFEEDDDE